MRRRAIAACFLAAGLSAAAPPAPAVTGQRSRHRLAVVKVVACDRADHLGAFYGRMRALPGTQRMWMRFALLESTSSGWRPVRAPALGRWRKSRPRVQVFGFRQRVLGLSEGEVYRARVEFRWYDADRRLIRRVRRRSGVCAQTGPLPNLRVAWIALGRRDDLPPGIARYRVAVENTGRAPTAPVAVSLAIDGHTVDTTTVSPVVPGEIQVVRFTGPVCERPDSLVRAVADPGDAIHESAENDNVRRIRCADLLG